MITNFIVPFSLFHPPPLCPSLGPVVVRVVISSNANGDGHRDGLALAPLSLSPSLSVSSLAAGGRHRSAAIPCTRSRPLSLSLSLSFSPSFTWPLSERATEAKGRSLACSAFLLRAVVISSFPPSLAPSLVALSPAVRRAVACPPPPPEGRRTDLDEAGKKEELDRWSRRSGAVTAGGHELEVKSVPSKTVNEDDDEGCDDCRGGRFDGDAPRARGLRLPQGRRQVSLGSQTGITYLAPTNSKSQRYRCSDPLGPRLYKQVDGGEGRRPSPLNDTCFPRYFTFHVSWESWLTRH